MPYLTRHDWPLLRQEASLTLGMAAVAVVLFLITWQIRAQEDERVLAAQRARDDVQARIENARREEQEVRDNLQAFEDLRRRRVLGPEQRLEWLELLRAAAGEQRLAELGYDFAASTPGPMAGAYTARITACRLSMLLPHETALLDFLDSLHRQAPAIVTLRGCQVERNAGNDAAVAGLKALCDLDWINLARVEAASPEGQP